MRIYKKVRSERFERFEYLITILQNDGSLSGNEEIELKELEELFSVPFGGVNHD